jgi:hypothetical protein
MQMATIEQLNLLMRQFNINTNNNTSVSKDSIAINAEILSLPIVQKVVLAYEKELQEIKDNQNIKNQQNKCNCCCHCGVTSQTGGNTSTQDILEVSKVIEDLHNSCSESFSSLEKRLNELARSVDKLMSFNSENKSFVVVDVDVEPEIKIEKVNKVESTKHHNVLPSIKETEHIKLEIQEKVVPGEVEELVKETETVSATINIKVPIVDNLLSNIGAVNDKVVEEEEEEVTEDDVESEEEVATDVSEEDIKETGVVKGINEEVVEEEDEVVEEEDEVVEEEDEVVEEEDEVVEEEVDEVVEEEDEVVEEVKDKVVEKKQEVIEVEEEEDDEEVFEIEIDDVTYYATDEENGILYEVTKTGDVGKKVGIIKDGEPIFS